MEYPATPATTGNWNREPVRVGDRVRVVAYGYGATLDMVGRNGVVTDTRGRTRVLVAFDTLPAARVSPGVLALVSRSS